MNAILADLFHYGANWNMILLAIIGCSIISFTIFIERLLQLKKSETDTNQLVILLRKTIKEGNIIEAIQTCENTGGTVANIIKAGLIKHNRNKEQIENA